MIDLCLYFVASSVVFLGGYSSGLETFKRLNFLLYLLFVILKSLAVSSINLFFASVYPSARFSGMLSSSYFISSFITTAIFSFEAISLGGAAGLYSNTQYYSGEKVKAFQIIFVDWHILKFFGDVFYKMQSGDRTTTNPDFQGNLIDTLFICRCWI